MRMPYAVDALLHEAQGHVHEVYRQEVMKARLIDPDLGDVVRCEERIIDEGEAALSLVEAAAGLLRACIDEWKSDG